MASRTDQFIDGKSARVNPKDGFAILECKEARARRVLESLVRLVYTEKPIRVTIMVGNTIFGALFGERPVDWGQVMKDVVQRLFAGMGKSKATPICPYVFHIYHTHKVLLLVKKKKKYRIVEALLKHSVEPEEEGEPEALEESEHESLSSQEIQEIQAQEYSRMKKSPHNKRGSSTRKGPTQQQRTLPI